MSENRVGEFRIKKADEKEKKRTTLNEKREVSEIEIRTL